MTSSYGNHHPISCEQETAAFEAQFDSSIQKEAIVSTTALSAANVTPSNDGNRQDEFYEETPRNDVMPNGLLPSEPIQEESPERLMDISYQHPDGAYLKNIDTNVQPPEQLLRIDKPYTGRLPSISTVLRRDASKDGGVNQQQQSMPYDKIENGPQQPNSTVSRDPSDLLNHSGNPSQNQFQQFHSNQPAQGNWNQTVYSNQQHQPVSVQPGFTNQNAFDQSAQFTSEPAQTTLASLEHQFYAHHQLYPDARNGNQPVPDFAQSGYSSQSALDQRAKDGAEPASGWRNWNQMVSPYLEHQAYDITQPHHNVPNSYQLGTSYAQNGIPTQNRFQHFNFESTQQNPQHQNNKLAKPHLYAPNNHQVWQNSVQQNSCNPIQNEFGPSSQPSSAQYNPGIPSGQLFSGNIPHTQNNANGEESPVVNMTSKLDSLFLHIPFPSTPSSVDFPSINSLFSPAETPSKNSLRGSRGSYVPPESTGFRYKVKAPQIRKRRQVNDTNLRAKMDGACGHTSKYDAKKKFEKVDKQNKRLEKRSILKSIRGSIAKLEQASRFILGLRVPLRMATDDMEEKYENEKKVCNNTFDDLLQTNPAILEAEKLHQKAVADYEEAKKLSASTKSRAKGWVEIRESGVAIAKMDVDIQRATELKLLADVFLREAVTQVACHVPEPQWIRDWSVLNQRTTEWEEFQNVVLENPWNRDVAGNLVIYP